MTLQQQEIFELYQKLGKKPSVRSMSLDFGLSKEESERLIEEWRTGSEAPQAQHGPDMSVTVDTLVDTSHEGPVVPETTQEAAKSTAEATEGHKQVKQSPPAVKASPASSPKAKPDPSMLGSIHSVHEDVPAVRWAIKIIALLIAISCLVRGFIIIKDYNGDQWFSYLMPIIMQGISLIFPVIAFTEARKRRVSSVLGALFFLLLSATSISYEVQISLDSFYSISMHNQEMTNGKKESLVKSTMAYGINNDRINILKTQIANDQTLLNERMKQFKYAWPGTKVYTDLQNRINNIQDEMRRYNTELGTLLSNITPEAPVHQNTGIQPVDIGPSVIIPIVAPICFGVFLLF